MLLSAFSGYLSIIFTKISNRTVVITYHVKLSFKMYNYFKKHNRLLSINSCVSKIWKQFSGSTLFKWFIFFKNLVGFQYGNRSTEPKMIFFVGVFKGKPKAKEGGNERGNIWRPTEITQQRLDTKWRYQNTKLGPKES